MKSEEVINLVNKIIYSYDVPLTLRQIYYRLVSASVIPNNRSAYNGLSNITTKARENGDIDDSRIVDRSRRIDDVSFDSPEAFSKACQNTLKQNYVRRFWDTQQVYCEVWVEKDALSQVIGQAVYDYNTIVAPSKGYSSYTYLKDAANRIRRYCKNGSKEAVILYFGDHDPSGIDMTRDLQTRLDKYCGNVKVSRIALTYNQVQQYTLIPNFAKVTDTRARAYIKEYGPNCWELDAIEPNELIRLCTTSVGELIVDLKAWEDAKQNEQKERNQLTKKLRQLQSGGILGRKALNIPVTKVCDALASGRTVLAAANILGCSRAYIYRELKAAGKKPKDYLRN